MSVRKKPEPQDRVVILKDQDPPPPILPVDREAPRRHEAVEQPAHPAAGRQQGGPDR